MIKTRFTVSSCLSMVDAANRIRSVLPTPQTGAWPSYELRCNKMEANRVTLFVVSGWSPFIVCLTRISKGDSFEVTIVPHRSTLIGALAVLLGLPFILVTILNLYCVSRTTDWCNLKPEIWMSLIVGAGVVLVFTLKNLRVATQLIREVFEEMPGRSQMP